jgi:hypothetical protein
MLKHYKELKVWQKSYELCIEIYRNTDIIGRGFRFNRKRLAILKKEMAEIERMLKALIKSLENKPLNP